MHLGSLSPASNPAILPRCAPLPGSFPSAGPITVSSVEEWESQAGRGAQRKNSPGNGERSEG